jgi:hypothetical protein
MAKYLVKAYADWERRLKEQRRIINAENEEEAWTTAWKLFPEYKELQVLKQFDNTFDAPTLSKLENGVFLPTPYQVIKLTLFFECEPLELVALDLYALDVCVANKAVASCEKGA